MKILLSCVGRRSYLVQFLREALGSDDLLIGTSNTPWSPALRFCDRAVRMPSIVSDEYPGAMIDFCSRENVAGLLSFLDHDVDRLANIREELGAAGVLPFIPSAEASRICLDKMATHDFLIGHGFDTPATFCSLADAEAALATGKISFPLIVKPRFGFGSSHIYVARNADELRVFFHYVPDMMIQEKIVGEERDFEMFNDPQGRVLSVVPWKKMSHRAGEADLSQTIEDPEMLATGARLSGIVGQTGPLDADVIYSEGRYYIIEMNPRFGGGYPVTHLAGGDFTGMIVKLLRGEAVEPRIGDYRRGVVMMKDYTICKGEPPDLEMWK